MNLRNTAGRFAMLIALMAAPALAQDAKIRVSDSFPVFLTFDKAEEKKLIPAKPAVKAKKKKCGGGGLVGAINCVTKKIEGAGSGGGSAGTPAKEIITPAISIIMRGSVTPKITSLDDRRYKLTFDVAISQPQFSPGRSQIPADIVRQAIRDEASVKLGFKRWQVILNKSSFASDPVQSHSFDAVFADLALLTLRAPASRLVKVYVESDACGPLQQDYLTAQRNYQDALAAMPVLDQFELVTRTLDEVEDALGASAKDLKAGADKIGQVTDKSPLESKIEELMGKTKDLSSTVTDTLGEVQAGIKKEREELLKLAKLDKPLKGLKGGLEKGAKNFEKVSKAAGEMNKKIRKLERLIKAQDASPSEQLKLFKEYFTDARDLVGDLVKTIPGLGVFLDLYAQAIEQIAHSAERIEAVVNERNKMAKKLGIPSPYVTLANTRERAKREQRKLYEKIQALGRRLIAECPGVDMSTKGHGKYAQMDDAVHRARSACKRHQPDMKSEWALLDRLKAARAAMYKDDADLLRPTYRKEKKLYQNTMARYKKLKSKPAGFKRRELGELLKDVRAFYTDQRQTSKYDAAKNALMAGQGLSRVEMIGYQAYLKTRFNAVKRRYDRLKNASGAKRDYLKAKKAYDSIRGQHKVYRACIQKYVRQLAQKNGWNPRLVRGISSSAY